MSKKCYRYYGTLLSLQERWLNKMAADGYRLTRTGKMLYEFTECPPGQYQYRVEFIAEKSRESAEDYAHFLEGCGYRVFFKNANLSYSVGKVRLRPWAEKGGRVATKATTFNRELLIVEKEADGEEFELHTTYEDRQKYYKNLRKPWLFSFWASGILGIALRTWVGGIFCLALLIPLSVYQAELMKLKKQGEMKEW